MERHSGRMHLRSRSNGILADSSAPSNNDVKLDSSVREQCSLSPSPAVLHISIPAKPELVDGSVNEASQSDHPDSDMAPPKRGTPAKPSQKRVAAKGKSPARKRARRGPNYDADFVIEDPKSPLTHLDEKQFKNIFVNPEAFNVLTREEKFTLFNLLPKTEDASTRMGSLHPSESSSSVLDNRRLMTLKDGEPVVNLEYLKYDPDWAHALSRFQEDIREGRNDPDWLSQAIAASKNRRQGKFDDFKEREYEEFWGSKQKVPYDVLAGDSSKIKLEALFKGKRVLPGDILNLSRNFKGTSSAPGGLVEKEATVVGFELDPFRLEFSYPPGRWKQSNPSEREDLFLKSEAPGDIMNALIAADGRVQAPPAANGWKLIRVIRRNQDVGTLWDLRQALYFAQQPPDPDEDELA